MRIDPLSPGDSGWDAVQQAARACSWRAGPELADKMQAMDFLAWERVFAAMDGETVAGFCTLLDKDCLPNVPYGPYIGYVFVTEAYRGKRLSQQLCQRALAHAASLGHSAVYLVSDHENLYEKYGFVPIDHAIAPWGAMETIFRYAITSTR